MPDAVLDQILDEIDLVEPECGRCGRPMISARHWSKADAAERWELWLEGYEAISRGRTGSCGPCSWQPGPLRADELVIRDNRRFRHLRYKALLDEGLTSRQEIAGRLGITPDGLLRNVKNWKERGWL